MPESIIPTKNRRRVRRRLPRSRVRVTCRRGVLDLGPNLALSMEDVSDAGVRLLLKEPLEPGCKVSVGLEGQTHSRPTVRVGRVVWCLPTAEGAHWAGIQFEKELPYQFVLEISREPMRG